MSGQLSFAVVFAVREEKQVDPPHAIEGRDGRSLTASVEVRSSNSVHVVLGELANRTVPLANQTAPTVADCLSNNFALPEHCAREVADIMPAVHTLRGSDMHH